MTPPQAIEPRVGRERSVDVHVTACGARQVYVRIVRAAGRRDTQPQVQHVVVEVSADHAELQHLDEVDKPERRIERKAACNVESVLQEMRIAEQAAVRMQRFGHLVIEKKLLGRVVARAVQANGVAAMPAAWRFLTGDQGVSVLLEAAGRTECILREVGAHDVRHLQHVGHMQILGAHLTEHDRIVLLASRDVHVHITRVPTRRGCVRPTLEPSLHRSRAAGFDLQRPPQQAVLRALHRYQLVLAGRDICGVVTVNVERVAARSRPGFTRSDDRNLAQLLRIAPHGDGIR